MPESDIIKEDDVLRIACLICSFAPGRIWLMGGGMVTPSILHVPRARRYNTNLDFLATKEGFNILRKSLPLIISNFHPNLYFANIGQREDFGTTHIESFLIYLCVGQILDLVLDQERFLSISTPYGVLSFISPELNAALKMRRSVMNGKFYGKDVLDIPALLTCSLTSFEDYMKRYTCPSCRYGGGCFGDLLAQPAAQSLPNKYQRGVEYLYQLSNNFECRYNSR